MTEWVKRDANAPTLRADFIRCWALELVKPERKQAKNKLMKKNGAACCLGVAEDIKGTEKHLNKEYYLFGGDRPSSETLTNKTCSFLQMDGAGGLIIKTPPSKSHEEFVKAAKTAWRTLSGNNLLSEANDQGVTFIKIATVITSFPEVLFEKLTKEEEKYIKETIPLIPSYKDWMASKKAFKEGNNRA